MKTFLLTVVCIVLYFLVACVAAWLFGRVLDKDNATWSGILWPVTGPFAILILFFMGIVWAIQKVCTWMDGFVQERFGW